MSELGINMEMAGEDINRERGFREGEGMRIMGTLVQYSLCSGV
jgi:hypothetical protein